jgi:hypothetical protein
MPLNTALDNPNTFNLSPADGDRQPSMRGACSWFERPMTGNNLGDQLQAVDIGYATYTWAGAEWIAPLPASSITLKVVAPVAAAGQISLGSTTATTVGAAGGAAALPATPLGYMLINVAGAVARIPYYN